MPLSERLACIVIPWLGFFAISVVLTWQNTTVPNRSSLVLGGDVQYSARAVPDSARSEFDPSSYNQLDATQQRESADTGVRQPAVDHGDDDASSETWPVSRCVHISSDTSGFHPAVQPFVVICWCPCDMPATAASHVATMGAPVG